jgi:hypothetical protein
MTWKLVIFSHEGCKSCAVLKPKFEEIKSLQQTIHVHFKPKTDSSEGYNIKGFENFPGVPVIMAVKTSVMNELFTETGIPEAPLIYIGKRSIDIKRDVELYNWHFDGEGKLRYGTKEKDATWYMAIKVVEWFKSLPVPRDGGAAVAARPMTAVPRKIETSIVPTIGARFWYAEEDEDT